MKYLTRSFSTRRTYDFVVMGGGPIGSSIALHLAQQGQKNVLVVEKDPCYTKASAMLSAGGIRQQFSAPENIKMSIYGARFLKNMDNLKVDGDLPDVQFHENGYLFLAGKHNKDILEANIKTQHECGAHWIELLNKKQLETKFSWLNTDSIDFGSYGSQNEGYFDPWLLVNTMKRKAISLGVEYMEGEVISGKVEQQSTTNLRMNTLNVIHPKTKHNYCISGGVYINASGAFSGHLLDNIANTHSNPKIINRLPVKPRKRCIFAIHCPGLEKSDKPVPPSNTPLVIDPTGVYFRPEINKSGRFIAGVSPPEDNDPDCTDFKELEVVDHSLFNDIIWPVLYERVPAFQELKVTSSWAGFYDYNTLDQNAIIGYHTEIQNLMLCTGFSGHGLQQSPAAGLCVSELLLNNGKFKTIDVSRFSYERIVDKKPIFETGIV